MRLLRTTVAIIGAGPAGLLLAELLHREGIDSVVIERASRAHVLSRIRAGVLEQTTVDVLRQAGVAERMGREGHAHDGVLIAWAGHDSFFLDTWQHAGKRFVSYGQVSLQEDLFAAADRRGATLLTDVEDVVIHHFDTAHPKVTASVGGQPLTIDCDFVAGCDGFHGVSRRSIAQRREFEKVYPFGWLGILSRTPPLPHVTYVNHPRGFALASQRNELLSRYYIQVPLSDKVEDWPDERFWPELKARFPQDLADAIVEGPSIEKSVAPLRSFVCETMQQGRLFLCGDAAHIVPPTGAKGLNLAASDVFYLARGLSAQVNRGDDRLLRGYGATALRRVWSSVRTSWYLTNLLHRYPDTSEFDQRAQEAELDYLTTTPHALAALADMYAGRDFEPEAAQAEAGARAPALP